jgi:hypothetical protein
MEIKPTFTLGESLENELNMRKLDVSSNFMNGIDTSPYNPKNIVGQAQGQINALAGQAQQGYQNIAGNVNNMISTWGNADLKKELFGKIWDYIESDIESYMNYKIDEFIAQTSALVAFGAERIIYWTGLYTGEAIQKAVQDFYKDSNEEGESQQIDNEKAEMQKQVQDTLAKAQEIKQLVVNTSSTIYSSVEEITSVLSAGPEYIVNNVNKVYDKAVTPLKAQLDQMTKKGVEEAKKAVDKGAEAVGKWMAKKSAKAIQKVTGALLTMANVVKAKAKSFAKAALNWAINLAKSLAGA